MGIKRRRINLGENMEPIYNIDELINKLLEIKKQLDGNAEVYIKEIYASGEYLRISDIRINEEGDVIIEDNELA